MERLKADLYTTWCWAACGLSTAFWATVSILGSLCSRSGKIQHFCMRRWSCDNLRLSRVRIEIEGLENLDRRHAQLLVANHSGFHDILSLAAHLPIQFRWIAKKSLFGVPFMGWHMRRSGYIPIDRENLRDTVRSIQEAARVIQNGTSAVIFPEGSRSLTGELGKFYSGAFALALQTGVPLVPVAIEGSYRVILPMRAKVNPGVIIRIYIGRAVDVTQYGRHEKQRLMEDVFQIMSRNLDMLRARRRPNEEREDPIFRWVHRTSAQSSRIANVDAP